MINNVSLVQVKEMPLHLVPNVFGKLSLKNLSDLYIQAQKELSGKLEYNHRVYVDHANESKFDRIQMEIANGRLMSDVSKLERILFFIHDETACRPFKAGLS